MQTALLGIATALILALIAALAGPFLIDWSRYRAEFERQSAWITGLEFRIRGPIQYRLLPSPTVVLHDVELGNSRDGNMVRARAFHLEYALGPMMRGELRVENAWVDAPEFEIELDESGRLIWPFPASGFAPQELAIQRLTLSNGRVTFIDRSTRSRLLLEKVEFTGTVRSLIGPLKGDGAFAIDGQNYPYRLSANRVGEDGSVRLRLNLEPTHQPFTADLNLAIRLDRRVPQIDGSIAMASPLGRTSSGMPTNVAWRVSSRIKGNSAAAELEHIELQYGPDDAAVRLRGNGRLTFGSKPSFSGALSASQLDLDRILALPPETRRRPAVALKALADRFAGIPQVPLPARLSLGVEMLTLAGATLQRVSSQLRNEGDGWTVDTLELRAPGLTQMRLTGGSNRTSQAAAFKGAVNIESGDPRALLAWLTERADAQAAAPAALRLNGEFSVAADAIAIERLSAEIDRMTVRGSFAYAWKGNDRPARLDAELTTPELNVDRIRALTKAILGDSEFDRPREGRLALKIGRASVGDIEAKQVDTSMRIDVDGLEIDRLEIADLSGISLAVKGRIDTRTKSPHGALTVAVGASSLERIQPLVEKLAPEHANEIRKLAGRLTPFSLRGSLTLDGAASTAGSTDAMAKFLLDGRAGSFVVALRGETSVASEAFKIDDSTTLTAARVNVTGELQTDEGDGLIDLMGLEHLVVADRRPGRLRLAVQGPLNGELAIEGRIEVSDLAISTKGTVHADHTAAALEVDIANAKLRFPGSTAADGTPQVLPTSLALRIALADNNLRLSDVRGSVAGSTVAGQLALELHQQPISVTGEFEVSAINLTAAIGAGIGVRSTEASDARWSAEPFQPAVRRASGQIALKARQVVLTPKLGARDIEARLHMGETQLALQVIDGRLAGGRINGELVFLSEGADVIARTRVQLMDANAAELIPGDDVISGQLALDMALEGAGRSPIALVGALEGSGRVTLSKGRLARFDPAALTAAVRAADAGLPVDAARIRGVVEAALAKGALAIRRAEAGINIEAGQARMLSNPTLESSDVDLAVVATVNLAEGVLDARATLSGTPSAPTNTAPHIVAVFKGPIDSPERMIDVTALSSWLALRAIEQQSKKLDVLEGRDAGSGAASTGGSSPRKSPARRRLDRASAHARGRSRSEGGERAGGRRSSTASSSASLPGAA